MEADNNRWIETKIQLPPKEKVIETKVDDENGLTNVQELKFGNPLWFHPDGKMYVYYTPTHWREKVVK